MRWEDRNTVRPSAARSRTRERIHSTPSGSRPLTGSSNMTVAGSPSSAAAMPSRWPMPREKPLTRLPATGPSPVRPMTSSTGTGGCVGAGQRQQVAERRPARVDRAGVEHGADRVQRGLEVRVPLPVDEDGARGRAFEPRTIRIVVDFPAPLGPRKPVTVPGWAVNDNPSTAVVVP